MKEAIAVVTDTNSGLSPEQADSYEIHLVPMPVIVNEKTYFEGITLTQETFFSLLRQGATVSTAQPSPGDLLNLWDELLETHDKILYLPMSSGLSGSCETARALAQEYDGRIYVIDNHRISVTLRQSVLEAKRMAAQGKSAGEIAQYLEADGLNASIYVAVNTLEYLKKSGRVTAAGAAIGTLLNLKPVLQIQGGKLDAYRKSRGMPAAMEAMIAGLQSDRMSRFAGQKVGIRAAYSGDLTSGEAWRDTLQRAFPDLTVELDALPISIACHTGDGALGAGIMQDIL